jgi:cysteine desulfurase
MTPSVYLDHNATTPLRPQAIGAMREAMQCLGNPSSVHRHGRLARRLVEEAREQVAELIGSDPANVVFTGSGTETNALALRGTGRLRVLVSAVEHASVLQALGSAEIIPVDTDGIVRLDALAAMLEASEEPALVSVMLANNETGVLQPLPDIVVSARRHGALVHCDAVQAVGKITVDFRTLGVHLLSLSAHKLGGPAGIGALVVDPRVPLTPLMRGGGQERGRRAGSENVIGIVGFGAAAKIAGGLGDSARLAELRDGLERRIRAISPSVRLFGAGAERLPNTTCVEMPGIAGETQVIAFDLAGISLSAGSACSSGKVAASHVLKAMGLDEDIARTAVRVSMGWTTHAADVDRFIEVWTGIYGRARACRPASAVPGAVARRSEAVSSR